MSVSSVVVGLFLASIFLEGLLYQLTSLWRFRKAIAMADVALIAFCGSAVLTQWVSIWAGLYFLIALYRLCNAGRVAEGRMHEAYLRQATRRSAGMLALLQLAALILVLEAAKWQGSDRIAWLALGMMQLAVAVLLILSTVRSIQRTAWPGQKKHYTDKELPTLTVAIPARNETEDLNACLETLVTSDYPKLEVLVFDDCSQSGRTSEIIRSFAHAGIRFVQGEEPQQTWLPKNRAYSRLAEEASGEYILFCGVDVRFTPQSIRHLAEFMMASKKDMVSILPRRRLAEYGQFALLQSLRYWWELVPPRRFWNRPPVMSTCWAIRADVLWENGGFAAVTRSIVPEAYFAKRLLKTDGYSFRRSDTVLGIESTKSTREQRATAVRTRYPQLHRRPENVLLATLVESTFLLLPFGVAVAGVWDHQVILSSLAVVSCLLLIVSYMYMTHKTHVARWWFALGGLPLMVIADICLLQYSMWKYEFSVVTWKGRNVCIPTMHTIPHLPPLPKESKI